MSFTPLTSRCAAGESSAGRGPQLAQPLSPVAIALRYLEAPWTLQLIWALFWGPRSFSELLRATPGLGHRTLRLRLTELETSGLVRSSIAVPGARPAYRLTELGESAKPVVAVLYEWGLHVSALGAPTHGSGPARSV